MPLFVNMVPLRWIARIGLVSGVVGNLFRFKSTDGLRTAGKELLEKGTRKFVNGIENSSKSTLKRVLNYWDEGAALIQQFARRAGTNSGLGSAVGSVVGLFFN